MKNVILASTLACFAALLSAGPSRSVEPCGPQASRGSYLVRNVAMCIDCHGATLHGNTVPGAAMQAPSIAHGAGLTQAQITDQLMNGTMPPPMPRYHLNREDAAAIARYIVSVR